MSERASATAAGRRQRKHTHEDVPGPLGWTVTWNVKLLWSVDETEDEPTKAV